VPGAVGEVTVTLPHEPLAGQLSVEADRLLPPLTDRLSVVGVWPPLLNDTVPEAGVGEVVADDSWLVDGLTLGGVNTVKLTGTEVTDPPADEPTVKVPA
jgi:hypothetical protein